VSYHVYIARSEFKETPIEEAEWLAAARSAAQLSVGERTNRAGRKIFSIHLKDNKRERLHRTQYGLIDAQDPSPELVAVMFDLARILEARVYSERLKPYSSVEDWRRRTGAYRERRDAARSEAARVRTIRRLKILVLIAVSAAVGIGLSLLRAA
jgi:hypothetical protein